MVCLRHTTFDNKPENELAEGAWTGHKQSLEPGEHVVKIIKLFSL